MDLNQFAWEGDDFHTPGVYRIIGTIASGAMGASASRSASRAQSDAAKYATDMDWKMFEESNRLQEPFRQGGLWALEQLIGTPGTAGYWEYPDSGTGSTQGSGGESLYRNPYGSGGGKGGGGSLSYRNMPTGYQRVATESPGVSPEPEGRWVPGTEGTQGLISRGAPELDFDSFKDSPWYTLQRDEGIRALESSAAGSGMLQSGNTGKALMNYGSDYAYGKALDVHNTETSDWINTQLNPLLSILGTGQVSSGQMANNAMQAGAGMGANARYAGEAAASGYLGQAAAYGNMASGIGSSVGTALKSLFGMGGGGANLPTGGTWV